MRPRRWLASYFYAATSFLSVLAFRWLSWEQGRDFVTETRKAGL